MAIVVPNYKICKERAFKSRLTDLSSTDYHFFKQLNKFLQDRIFKDQVVAQSAIEEFIGSRTPEFHATRINKFVRQKYVDLFRLIKNKN